MPILNAHEFLTPVQTAEYLGVTVETLALWRCVKRYPIPYARIGRAIRYKRADLDTFIESRTVNPPKLQLA
jgi:excisionase family DNA binding protein